MARFVLAKKRDSNEPESGGSPPEDWTWMQVLDILGSTAIPLHDLMSSEGENVRILLLEANKQDVLSRASELPPWIRLEKEIRYRPQGKSSERPSQKKLVVRATGNGKPLVGAVVTLLVRKDSREFPNLAGETDGGGEAIFNVDPSMIDRVVLSPMTGYWPMVVDGPGKTVEVDCPAIQFSDDGLGWWHHLVGIHEHDPNLGAAIRIGVLDTGAADHEALEHIQWVGTWNGGTFDSSRPSAVHGTHVCGIISARPRNGRGFWGVAPGAVLLAGNVCENGYANQEDIAYGVLDLATKHCVDIINLSLGSHLRSRILLDAIRDALEVGCICICAAGNTRGTVQWPARSRNALAVSAVGKRGVSPSGSLAESCLLDGEAFDAGDGVCFAQFSCHGPEINCCGPGVGIVSTIPEQPHLSGDFWAAMDGTSMAAPVVSAALAVRLSRSARYLELPRNRARSRRARNALMASCQRGRIHEYLQGKGIPTARKPKPVN